MPCISPLPAESACGYAPRSSATLAYLGLDLSFPEKIADAEKTIASIQAFNTDERVLVVFALDVSMSDILDFYPDSANEWKEKG